MVRSWFVSLPDHDGGAELATVIRAATGASREIAHPSGRPWLLGDWQPRRLTTALAGDVRLVVLGQHHVDTDTLERAAARTDSVGAVDQVARRLTGSAHLLASVAGTVRAQGTVSGLRRLFHATVGGRVLAASRADVLASLCAGAVDDDLLAARLLAPLPPWPLFWRPVWREVNGVPPHHYLRQDRDGSAREIRWWHPPEPDLCLAEGAREVSSALAEAVRVRTTMGPVSSDLSGLDSTALCALAARSGQVSAFTCDSPDPMDDDVAWARHNADAFAGVTHEVVDDAPDPFHNALSTSDLFDEPFGILATRSRFGHLLGRAADAGSAVHLAGFGGDELFTPMPATLHTLARTNRPAAARLTRGLAAKARNPLHRVVRELFDNEPYGSWIRRAAHRIGDSVPAPNDRQFGWAMEPRLAPWLTERAGLLAAASMRELARFPLAADRGRHRTLEAIHAAGASARHFTELAAGRGVELAVPYLDDRVLEAALAVGVEQVLGPWRYKPLLVESMRGVLPGPTLERTTKAETSALVERGYRRHRDQLLGLADDPVLAARGLVRAELLRESCRRPVADNSGYIFLNSTFAVEHWLRSAPAKGWLCDNDSASVTTSR